MARKLPIVCPSVDDPAKDLEERFTYEACGHKKCVFWKGRCEAEIELAEEYAEHTSRRQQKGLEMPVCDLAPRCRWHVQSLKEGRAGCVPRQLGMLCQHQGGEWMTFDMAPADEDCWRED